MASLQRHTIYIVRHGESVGNIKQSLLGRSEDVLTDHGVEQAVQLGKHLSDVGFTAVYTSDYQRAQETAKSIVQYTKASHIKTKTDIRLREINYGTIQGKSYKEGFESIKTSSVPILEWKIPEGESFPDSGERMEGFWKELCTELGEKWKSETILMVGHSVALASFMSVLSKSTDYNLIDWNPKIDLKVMKNASYMKVEVVLGDNGKIDIKFLNKHCVDHLKNQNQPKKDALNNFVSKTESAKEFANCIQQ